VARAKYRNILTPFLNEDGFTLLEAVIASAITAGTLVIVLLFSMRSFEIASEINTVNDINHSFRRTQRAFVRDVQMAQYFFFGADVDNENNQIPNEFIDRRVMTVGRENENGEMIWSRFAVKIGTETTVYYLLVTTNELEGAEHFETNIIASNVQDMYFVYYDEDDIETTKAEDVRRIEMTLVLEEDDVTDMMHFSSTLRGENLGVALPDENIEVHQDTNFVK
jgi:hypothetical protein